MDKKQLLKESILFLEQKLKDMGEDESYSTEIKCRKDTMARLKGAVIDGYFDTIRSIVEKALDFYLDAKERELRVFFRKVDPDTVLKPIKYEKRKPSVYSKIKRSIKHLKNALDEVERE